MRIRKESNITNSLIHQSSKMNKSERKEQRTFESTRKWNNKITGIRIYLWTLTLNVMVLTFQLKDADCLIGLKNNIQPCGLCKNTSHRWRHIPDWKWKDKMILQVNRIWMQAVVTVLTTEKVDCKQKFIKRHKANYRT
jgi:hypothetical protein